MIHMASQKLKIQDFEVWVHLGCSTEEQKHAQPVHMTLEINFKNPILGCQTDHLDDTIDYVKMTSIMKMIATEKPYQLIEHLSHQCLLGLLEYLKSKNVKATIQLSVQKIRVPVDNLRNGVVFTCEANL